MFYKGERMNKGSFRLSRLRKSSVVIMLILAFLILFAILFFFYELQDPYLKTLFFKFCINSLIFGLSILTYTIVRNSSNLRDINIRIYRMLEVFLFCLAAITLAFSITTATFATEVINTYIINIGRVWLRYIEYATSQLMTVILTNSTIFSTKIYSIDLITVIFQVLFGAMILSIFVCTYFVYKNIIKESLKNSADSKKDLMSIICERKVFVNDVCLGKPSKIALGVLYKPLP